MQENRLKKRGSSFMNTAIKFELLVIIKPHKIETFLTQLSFPIWAGLKSKSSSKPLSIIVASSNKVKTDKKVS